MHISAESSLGERLKKKILGKTSWYKGAKKNHKNPTKKIKKTKIPNLNFSAPKKIKSLLFVPRTDSSKLTKMLREEELKLIEITNYREKNPVNERHSDLQDFVSEKPF